jgi:hypothetical protein
MWAFSIAQQRHKSAFKQNDTSVNGNSLQWTSILKGGWTATSAEDRGINPLWIGKSVI